jgi:hypothetical protein
MRVHHLQHKHGGKIIELYSVRHEALAAGKPGSWELSGWVQWDDGSESRAAHIHPVLLCYDRDNKDAKAEIDAVLKAINEHLAKHGDWNACGEWVAKTRRGSTSLGATDKLLGIQV